MPEVGDCPLCFGRLLPLSDCKSCNTVAVQEGLERVGLTIACEDCGATNPTHFVCSACNARFSYGDIVKPESATCPSCRRPVPPGAVQCPICRAALSVTPSIQVRPKRRIRGEYAEENLAEVARIPGVSRSLAETLCIGGMNATWKVAKVSEEELAKVPGVGAMEAARIKGALQLLLLVPRRRGRESVLSEEFACPLCGTVTSLQATRCHECGAGFDEEEVDPDVRDELGRDEERSLLAFYDVRLLERPKDASLHFARGALLMTVERPGDALASFEDALQLEPNNARILQAKTRSLGAAKGVGSAARILRDLVDSKGPKKGAAGTSALEEEWAIRAIGALEEVLKCPSCGQKRPANAKVCSACGHAFGPKGSEEEPIEPAGAPEEPPLDDHTLLEDLERAVAGETRTPPPPLRPEIPTEVVDEKRSMLHFLNAIPGVGRRAAAAVAGFLQSLDQARFFDAEDLEGIPGVSPDEARLIISAVQAQFVPPTVSQPPPPPSPTQPTQPAPAIPVSPAPEPLPVHREFSASARRGLINGGLVDGRGRVNGLINGTGFVNGGSIANMRIAWKSLLPRYVAIGAALLMVFGVSVGLMPPPSSSATMVVDGNFGDWAGARSYRDATLTTNASVQIVAVSARVVGDALFLRMTVAGILFAENASYHTMYAFLDADPASTSGYDLGDVRADHMVRISGFREAVADARLLEFTGTDPLDWSGWTTVHALTAIAGRDGSPTTNAVEVEIPTSSLGAGFLASELLLRFVADDNAGAVSHTVVPIQYDANGLRADQSAVSSVLGSGVQPFLRVRLRATGGPVTVDSLLVAAENGTLGAPSPPAPWMLAADQTVEVTFPFEASSTAPVGAAAVAYIVSVDTSVPTAVTGPPARAYLVQAPGSRRIDGLFLDWTSPSTDTDSRPIRRQSLNILSRDAAVAGVELHVYTRLNGMALEGAAVAGRVIPPSPGGTGGPSAAPPGIPPRSVGHDFIRFYVQTNVSSSSGFEVNGLWADRLVEVRGRGGVVTEAALYFWSGNAWQREGPVTVGLGASEMEARATIAASFDSPQIVAATGDWAGGADMTDVVGTRAGGDPGLLPLDGTNPQTAIAKPLGADPTVDGNCGTTGSEYTGSDTYSNSDLKFFVGRRSAIAYVFACLEVISDGTDNSADWGELLFDQEHEDSSTPQANDRRFRITRGGTFTQSKGDGSGWTDCAGSCDSGNAAAGAFNNSRETYEFKIAFSDIWGSSAPQPNERAGFAVIAHNEGVADYSWGADNVNEGNPSTWGRLDIAEFPVLVAIAAIVLPLLVRRRRR